jgi:NADP-dependent 3-hydroxy acid dehydrogenase YdfG
LARRRNAEALKELSGIRGVTTIQADVRDTKAIAVPLADVEVDVLVNNAGILSTQATFQEIDPAEIDSMIDVNLKAPMHLRPRSLQFARSIRWCRSTTAIGTSKC